MTSRRFAALLAPLLAVLALAPAHPRAQQARGTPDRPTFGSTTTAVLVDVVVRDKKDRPVTDLQADDFELFEDDIRQPLGSFTRVAHGSGIGVNLRVPDPAAPTLVELGTPATPDPPTSPETEPAATALVFDALSSEAAAMCQKAAAQYLPRSGLTGARIGVFVTEPTVHMLQGYTDDPSLVRLAVGRVQPTNTIPKETQREQVDALRERREQLASFSETTSTAVAAGNPTGQGVSGNIGQLETERRLVRSQLQMVQAFDTMDRDHRGYGTTSALFAVVQSLVEMPGRKTLVFFSEGLPASPALQSQLRTVIDAANRSNISVYAIDANGLSALSATDDMHREIDDAGKVRMRQLSGGDPTMTDEPLTRAVERAEDLLKFNSQGGLARLSEETGGFLIRDTNDLRSGFRRIDEDIRFHYLLTYAPTNQNFDGKFRTIAVKVKRPSVDVYARKGYRALRIVPAMPVLEYEAPAIAALDTKTLPRAFPFTTTVLSFPESDRPGLSPVLVRVETDAITFDQDAAAGRYAGDAAVVVRFKNAAGEVVEKVSQQYHLAGRLAEIETARHGEILFYRQPVLAPGVYSVETAVTDTVGGRASAKVMTLEIPKPSADRVRVSSLLVIRRAERVAGSDRHPDNPLYVGDLLLYPNAGEPLSREHDRELSFYYIVYPHAPGARALETTMEVRRNGHALTRIPVTLGPADAQGRIQQMSRFPLEGLADGTYELCVFVHDGHRTIQRSTFFTVKG
jgi:VWFA-related protein